MDFARPAHALPEPAHAPSPSVRPDGPQAPGGRDRQEGPEGPASPPRPARLLLFVGEAVRPEAPLAHLLAREGLRCLSLPGAEQAVRAAALARFDAVLVDAALVDGRAIEALASAHRCPIVVLADQADEVDEIVALELGADLYLARPLAPRRLRAHVRALLRRRAAPGEPAAGAASFPAAASPSSTPSSVVNPTASAYPTAARDPAASPAGLQAGGWTLEPARLRLTRGARAVRLTHAQVAMLRCLMAAAGDIVPAPALLAALPQHERLQARSLRVHVHRLRQRLRDEGVDGLQVEAVRGSGYALALPLAEAA